MFTSSWNDSLLASVMDFRSRLCKENAFFIIILTITYYLNASKRKKWNMKTNKSIALLFTALSLPITVLPASSPASPPSPAPAPAWVLAMVWAWEGLEPEAPPPPWSSSRRWSTGSPAFTSNTSSSLEASSVPGELRISRHAQTYTHTHAHTHTNQTHTCWWMHILTTSETGTQRWVCVYRHLCRWTMMCSENSNSSKYHIYTQATRIYHSLNHGPGKVIVNQTLS